VNGSLPAEYRWPLRLAGIRGGLPEGFGYLEEYYGTSSGAERLEACLILRFTGQMMDMKKPSGQGSAIRSGDLSTHPGGGVPSGMDRYVPEFCGEGGGTLFLYAAALNDLASGNSRRVEEKLLNYRQSPDENNFPYLDLLLGEALLNGLDTMARESLLRFTEQHSGYHYTHHAWHKLSWSYALGGEWDLYREARRKVLDSPEPFLDADREAYAEAQDTLPLNTGLLKARLLFDGGYYPEAMAVLGDTAGLLLANRRDSIEYRYRMARIIHMLGERDRALEGYEKVLAYRNSRRTVPGNWYFIPNAALQMAMIYEEEGNAEKAIEYYRLCLKINRSAYRRSMDYKAEQGLSRMGR
jgi:tetratricopeptide (TPR) repeat protein